MNDDEMSPEAWRLLQVVRQAESPSELDLRRVRRAIAIGAGTAAGTAAPVAKAAAAAEAASVAKAAPAAQAATTTAATMAKGAALVSAVKGAAAIAVLASVGAGTLWWAQHHAPARGGVAALHAPATSTAAAPPPPSTLLEELTLLQRAQRALAGGEPLQALALAEQHAQRYPRSQLELERDAVRVFAWCALKRTDEARALTDEILEHAPRSPLRTSLEQSCARATPAPTR